MANRKFLCALPLRKTPYRMFIPRYTLQESAAEGFLEAASGPSGFLSLMETLIPELVSYFSKSISSLYSLWQHSTTITMQCMKKYLHLVCFKHAHSIASEALSDFCNIISPFTFSTALVTMETSVLTSSPYFFSYLRLSSLSENILCSMFLMRSLHYSEL